MSEISNKEIERLAELSRIKLSDEESVAFRKDIDSIVSFIGQIQEVGSDDQQNEIKNGSDVFHMLRNKFREDEEPHPTGAYSEEILNEAPQREGNYFKVKKIL